MLLKSLSAAHSTEAHLQITGILNSIANPDFQTAVGTALQILIVPTH